MIPNETDLPENPSPCRVRIFQHVPFEDAGCLETLFVDAHAVITRTKWFQGDSASETLDFDLLVVMGGPMGVYDEAEFPWLAPEKKAIKAALDSGKSVLGICLGAQLMAEVLGATVTKNPQPEIGWLPVERMPGTESNWAALCFPERFTTFHWHGDAFSLPKGAASLFRSEGCEQQGFAWGEKAVALQFHPEVTYAVIGGWVENGMGDVAPGPFVQTPHRIEAGLGYCAANNGWIAKLCARLMGVRPPQS